MDNEKIKDEKQAMVPYFLHESEMARLERMVKRMWILCIIMFLALVLTNAGWIVYESQYEDVVLEQEAETDSGIVNINGIGVGDMYVPESNVIPGQENTDGAIEHE